jgi:hypothetical protein
VSDQQWLLDQLPAQPKALILLFSSANDGWKLKDWRSNVICKGSTLTLFKSTKNRVAAGYLHRLWLNGFCDEIGDEKAFLCSVDFKLKFTPSDNPDRAAKIYGNYGPGFGSDALTVGFEKYMNAPNNC